MTEEYFPRGGKKPNVTYFKQSSNFLGAVEKGQGKKKKPKKRSEDDDGYLSDEAVKEVDQSYKMCAAGIGYKTLKPGLNILGRVSKVLETKLRISMPNKTEGNVMACHISEPYNKTLEDYVNDKTEKVRELPEMFSPGQYVAVHVLEADGGTEGVMLSMMPQHVNSGITHSDLKKGDILQAAVSSVEDHGFVMDIGVANARAFLPKAEANPEIDLDTGVLTWTSVKSVTTSPDNSIVTLSASQAVLQKSLRRKPGALLPGTAVEFTVDNPLDNGIEGRVLGDTTAYIQRFHVDSGKAKKPALGQKIKAHVLYVMPTRKAPFLTTYRVFDSARPALEEEVKFNDGEIIEEAQVLKIAGRSIHFKLGRKCVGTMSLKRVAVDEDLSDEQIVAQSYPIGSTHRVRVLTYNLSDHIYHVTDQAAMLTERYFCHSQLRPGELVEGTIRSVADSHVTVTVGRLSGYVPQTHLTDAGVYVDPKKASTSKLTKKKYKVGQEVTARVLSVDPLKQTLMLSLKPSLLVPDVKLLTSYQEAEVGKAYTGVIRVVKDFVLVTFLNEVTAYVPRNHVCRPPVANLAEAFHPGQVVTCTVLNVDVENKKMLGSLTLAPFWPAKVSPEHGEKRKQATDDNEVPDKKRKSSESDDTDTKKTKKDNKEKKNKSTDALEESDALGTKKNKKDKKNKGKKAPDASEESDAIETDIHKDSDQALKPEDAERYFCHSQLRPGELVEGTIRSVSDNHVTVTVGRLSGYVPQTHLSDAGVYVDPKKATTSELTKKKYKVGQEVTARVLSVDPLKQTLMLSLKPSFVAPDVKLLTSYQEAEVGKAYTGVIRVVKDFVLVSFLNEVTAYVPRNHVCRPPVANLTEAFHPGQVVTCTVLNVDVENKKMLGSLTLAPFWPAKVSPEHREKRKQATDDNEVPSKKRRSSESDETDTKKIKKDKKEKKNKSTDALEESDTADSKSNKKDKMDKKNITKKATDASEESDAIETDIHEDSDQVLKPEDLALLEFSDCKTAKQWKKRVVSLMKSIKCRLRRIERIDKKILIIQDKGLTAKNKKFHTAMHQEKLVIEERVKKLMEGMKLAQEKLQEFDESEYKNLDYIEKQKKKKEEKKKLREEKKKLKQAANDDDTDENTEVPAKKNKKKDKSKEKQKKEKAVEEKPKDRKGKKKGMETKKEGNEFVDKSKEIKVVESLEPALEVPSAKDFWLESADNLAKNTMEASSSSSEDEETEQPKKKRKKLTAAEKVAKARAEEERLRELERRAADSEAQPRSSEQFERALLANPNCSQLWIAYMAFHLQATEIDKARAVGRKALNTISFREEQEKLNVWLAMLNFENRFGTKESQQKTLEDALQMNDTFKVHSKLLDIYCDTSKPQELSALVDLMLRKYKREPSNYIQCGAACFKLGLIDKARHVMQKAVSVLEKKEHVTVLVQFALLERAHGERERAEAVFEQVLAVYPQRVDVCATYVDMLMRTGDVQAVRQVMERMTSQKLPARKIKTLFNKWVEIEERAGDAERAEQVRERAVKFMETAKF